MTISEERIQAEVAAEIKRIEAWVNGEWPWMPGPAIYSLASHLVRNRLQVEMTADSGLLVAAEAIVKAYREGYKDMHNLGIPVNISESIVAKLEDAVVAEKVKRG